MQTGQDEFHSDISEEILDTSCEDQEGSRERSLGDKNNLKNIKLNP
jgi:hypothetical protein